MDALKDALVRVGSWDVETLAKGIKDRRKKVRPITADVLSRIGPEAKGALPALYRSLKERRLRVILPRQSSQ